MNFFVLCYRSVNAAAFVIQDCAHQQVASGPMPQTVIENDIDPEIDNDEAHRR